MVAVFLSLLGAAAVCIPKVQAEDAALSQFISDTYQEEDVRISFNRAYCRTDNYTSQFCIELNLKVLSENKIIRPSRYIYGIYVLDNFGNDLNVINMAPRYCDTLRPGDKKLFIITSSIMPLNNTKYLLLQIPKGIFGNVNPFELKIFNTGFKETTEEERARLKAGIGFGNLEKQNAGVDFVPGDIAGKNRDKILYAAVTIVICALCSFAAMVFCCLRKAKQAAMRNEPLSSFCAHWLRQSRLRLSILYILSISIYLAWLMFGLIIVMAGGISNIEDMFGAVFFLAVWGLLSLVSLWVIYEALNKWRAINHNN